MERGTSKLVCDFREVMSTARGKIVRCRSCGRDADTVAAVGEESPDFDPLCRAAAEDGPLPPAERNRRRAERIAAAATSSEASEKRQAAPGRDRKERGGRNRAAK